MGITRFSADRAGTGRVTAVRGSRGVIAAGAAVGLLLLGACGSSDTDASSGTSVGGGSTSTSRFSPLEEFLSPSSSGQPSTPEDYAAKDKQIQELITTCMADQGFDYIPFVYPIQDSTSQPEMDWGSRSWTEKYGYGISTMDSGAVASSSTVVDPNQAIVEAMSDSEQQAYSEALYGGGMSVMAEASPAAVEAVSTDAVSTDAVSTDAVSTDAVSTDAVSTDVVFSEAVSTDAVSAEPSPDEVAPGTEDPASEAAPVSIPEETLDAGASMVSMQDQGCWGQAQAEVYGDMNTGVNSPDAQAQFQSMWDAYNNMYSEIETDQRVKDAATAWIDCMAAAGHPDLENVWSGNQQVSDKWSELNGWDNGMSIDGGGVVMSATAAATSTSPSAPPADELAAFKEYEIAIAVADWDCKDSSKYNAVNDEVRIELEKKFVDEHRSELEAYRDLMNSGG